MTDEEKKAIERIEDVFYQDLGKGINKIQKITLYEDSITDIRTVLNLIEKQSKEIEELKEKNEYLPNWVSKKYVSKDKIKAKIEEVEQWELYNMKIPRLSTLGERLGAKIGIKYVLQSLLEKE